MKLLKKTEYNTKIKNFEDKIPDIGNLASKTILNTKTKEVKNKIPSITGLATALAITAVEHKTPSISNLVWKRDYNMKTTEINKKLTDHTHDNYITIAEFKKLAANVFNARLAQANIVTKTDFYAKLSSLNRKVTSNKTKPLLRENELSYLRGKNYFDESGMQNYYTFQPVGGYLRIAYTNNINYVLSW